LDLIGVSYPSNAFYALQITNDIAAFDIFQGETIHDTLLEFKPTNSRSINFEAFGTSGMNFILNSGSLMLILMFMIVQSIIFYILNQICKIFFRYNIARQIGMRVYNNDLKLQLMVFALEGYLDYLFCSLLGLVSFY
jgi:hypothetical protein